jgi:spermidine synthase
MSRKKAQQKPQRVRPVAPAPPRPAYRGSTRLPALFAATLFLSALLLFLVQPMVARMALPLLGGTPAVWNTCLVFFQAVLLAGYAYAHASTAYLGVRRQIVLHLILLAVPVLLLLPIVRDLLPVLPITVRREWTPPGGDHPVPWLLGMLLVSVGLPFFLLSTSAPLLQKWFTHTGHPSARDPYFLYAASNLGSMLALFAYPVLLEPLLPLRPDRWLSQSWLWTAGYLVLLALTVRCAWAVWKAPPAAEPAAAADAKATAAGSSPPASRVWTRLRWVALAFVPSSLMMGATTYVSQDLAAIPLLWIPPLALYLLSFILVFSRWPDRLHRAVVAAAPFALLLVVFLMESEVGLGIGMTIFVHLLVMFVVALVCHGELARSRPPARELTGFYLWMSLGGVLGGLFNALVAPVVFRGVVEYQLAMVFACLLLPRRAPDRVGWLGRRIPPKLAVVWDAFQAALPGLVAFGLLALLVYPHLSPSVLQVRANVAAETVRLDVEAAMPPGTLLKLAGYGVPVLLCLFSRGRPVRFGLAVGALLLADAYWRLYSRPVVYQERSFFGVYKVLKIREGPFDCYQLFNGTTMHGVENLDPRFRDQPLAYFERTGPIGQVFAALGGKGAPGEIAVVGLGAGSLAAYPGKDQHLTFYDIDPAVERIATRYFDFLKDCRARGARCDVALGDGRLQLEKVPDGTLDLIVIDAFSSDSVPMHLLTREAVELYFRKLAPNGVVAFNISNRYLNLEPVLGNLADKLGRVGLGQNDQQVEGRPGKQASHWVVLARQPADLKGLDRRWHRVATRPKVGVWTDDYSNLLSVFR